MTAADQPRLPRIDLDELDRRVEQIDLGELSADAIVNLSLMVEVRRATGTLADERKGRKLSMRLAAVAVSIGLLLPTLVIIRWRADDARYSRQTCSQRIERSEQLRSAIIAAADAVALYVEVDDADRREVLEAVDEAVRGELPPPC